MAREIPPMSRTYVRARDMHRCAWCKVATHHGAWHHRRSRSVHDSCTHLPCNGVYLCNTDHAWVHANPFEARANGLIVSRYAIPCETPLNHALFGWVLLNHTGGYEPVAKLQD